MPTHVAIIQDGNRRFAKQAGEGTSTGHRKGAETAEQLLHWCNDLGIEEVTLYAFSTENFHRPEDEKEKIFDLLEEKLREFADDERIHEEETCIRVIGDRTKLPRRVRKAIDYAESRTEAYGRFRLNVAVAYGGRNQLLDAAKDITRAVKESDLAPEDIDVAEIERRLYDRPVRDVDLIIRTGGDERTSNFLPWHANGNEAAVFFCTPYWPEFRKIDFLRAIRTYENREQSWRRHKARRALTLLTALSEVELGEARRIIRHFKKYLPRSDRHAVHEVQQEAEPAD